MTDKGTTRPTSVSEKHSVENPRLRNLKRGGSPGRPKGKPNKVTQEVRTLAQRLVGDRQYRENLQERLRAGHAGPVEILLWHYAFGKPRDTTEQFNIDPSDWTDEQLAAYDLGVPIAQRP